MEHITPEERERAFAAKERELADREHQLRASEERFALRDRDLKPRVRFWMTFAAQILGFVLLVLLGFMAFPMGQENIARGLDFIRSVMTYYLIHTVLIFLLTVAVAAYLRRLSQRLVDFMLLAYVAVDLVLLLGLVYQEGGLCRSMFLPVFFLIPTAYLIVERRDKIFRWRRVVVLVIIVACMCSAYRVAKQLLPPIVECPPCPPALQPVEGTVRFLWLTLHVTDFSALSHQGYDKAVFFASLISAFVPIVQIFLIMLQDWFGDENPLT